MNLGRIAMGVVVSGACVACTAFTGTEPAIQTSASASDAATHAEPSREEPLPARELSTTPEAADAAAAEAPAVIEERFDATACGGWSLNGLAGSLDRDAHGGEGACRLCVPPSGLDGFLGRFFPLGEPGTYELEAWVKNVSLSATSRLEMGLKVEYGGDAGAIANTVRGFGVTSAWQRISVRTVAPVGPQRIQPTLQVVGDSGECVLVDDLVVRRVP